LFKTCKRQQNKYSNAKAVASVVLCKALYVRWAGHVPALVGFGKPIFRKPVATMGTGLHKRGNKAKS
jgi:hypothetical protein